MGRRNRARKRGRILVRRYGFFECDQCNNSWKSSMVYVWNYGNIRNCEDEEAAFGQKCRKCYSINYPYLIEPLRCRYCDAEDCECNDDQDRRINRRIPHKRNLCMKCIAGYPCEDDTEEHCPCY